MGILAHNPPDKLMLRKSQMGTSAQNLIDSFDKLPEAEKQKVASEILRRTINLDMPSLSDEELVLTAEELFLELDRREEEDVRS